MLGMLEASSFADLDGKTWHHFATPESLREFALNMSSVFKASPRRIKSRWSVCAARTAMF